MTENELSYKIIGVALELHKSIGPGLLESVYENALLYDLKEAGLKVNCQVPMPFVYKEVKMEVGIKSVEGGPSLGSVPIHVNYLPIMVCGIFQQF